MPKETKPTEKAPKKAKKREEAEITNENETKKTGRARSQVKDKNLNWIDLSHI